MTLFRLLALLQTVCLAGLLLRFMMGPLDFSALGLWVIALAVVAVSIPFSVWHALRHPARRRPSVVVLCLAGLVIAAPLARSELGLPPASGPLLGFLALLVGVASGCWLLSRPSLWRPGRFWLGARFNSVVLVVLLIWIVLMAAPLILGSVMGFAPPLGDERQGMSVDALWFHAIAVGSTGLALAVSALLFSLIGLWRNRPSALLHGAQLVASIMLVALLVVEAFLLSIMRVNPG